MDIFLNIIGWTALAILIALTYLVVPFLIWESTQDKKYGVALEPIIYWVFLIPASLVFGMSNINKLHLFWVFPLFGAVAWWINDTSHKWRYDRNRWINKITGKMIYGADEKTSGKFLYLWIGIAVAFILSVLMGKYLAPTINVLVGNKTIQIIALGFVGLIAMGIVILFMKVIFDYIRASKCHSCKKILCALDQGKPESESVALLVKAGLSGSIGYTCVTCGKKYCQRCMEVAGGVLCSTCKSPVKYLTK